MAGTLDFLVIGAQKAGTTALFLYLRSHPDIQMPGRKEEAFFSRPEAGCSTPAQWLDYMAEVSKDLPNRGVWGTATPQYMTGSVPGEAEKVLRAEPRSERLIPARIRKRLPEARLVAILRDPIERAISAYRMQVRYGLEGRRFDQAATAQLEPGELAQARREPTETNSYLVQGEYGRILSAYRDVFPSSQLLIVFTEHLERDPATVLRMVYEHIGVDPRHAVPDIGGPAFALSATRPRHQWLTPRAWEQRASQSKLLRRGWHAVPSGLRQSILRRYWDTSHRLFAWNQAPGDDSTAPPERGTVNALRSHYAPDVAILRRLIGQAPPWQGWEA